MKCPRCQTSQKQYKAGFNPSGSQRYRCGECNRVYTPEPLPQGYSPEKRMLAIRMYVEGSSQRSIGRILQVSPQTVANWLAAYTSKLPPAEVPQQPRTAELDEMYTFVGKKKTKSTS
jgi:transposase-like protein